MFFLLFVFFSFFSTLYSAQAPQVPEEPKMNKHDWLDAQNKERYAKMMVRSMVVHLVKEYQELTPELQDFFWREFEAKLEPLKKR